MNEINWKNYLLIGSLSIFLVACLAIQPLKPTKPTLQIEHRDNGGMCLSKEDTRKLGVYILELENR